MCRPGCNIICYEVRGIVYSVVKMCLDVTVHILLHKIAGKLKKVFSWHNVKKKNFLYCISQHYNYLFFFFFVFFSLSAIRLVAWHLIVVNCFHNYWQFDRLCGWLTGLHLHQQNCRNELDNSRMEIDLTGLLGYAYHSVLTSWHCTERWIMAKALCNDNKLSLNPKQLLINKALCPEH